MFMVCGYSYPLYHINIMMLSELQGRSLSLCPFTCNIMSLEVQTQFPSWSSCFTLQRGPSHHAMCT